MIDRTTTPEAELIKKPVDIVMLPIIIRGLRKSSGLKQQELGDMAGVSDATISYVESGRAQNIMTSIQVLAALGYTIKLHIAPTEK